MTALLLAVLVAAGLPEELHAQGRYRAAATEFQRRLFLGSSEPLLDRLRLGMSLAGSGETDRAAAALRAAAEGNGPLAPAATLALAGLHDREGRHALARFELLDGLLIIPDSARGRELNAGLGWLELRERNWTGAADAYERAGRTDLSGEMRRIDGLRPKNPTIALVLSSFVPGAGEFYAGRPVHGLGNLLVTGASAAGVYLLAREDDWVSAAVLFSLVFLRFYDGSRRNAADFARDFNRALRQQQLERLASTGPLEPDWFGPAERLAGIRFPAAETAAAPASAPARPE